MPPLSLLLLLLLLLVLSLLNSALKTVTSKRFLITRRKLKKQMHEISFLVQDRELEEVHEGN